MTFPKQFQNATELGPIKLLDAVDTQGTTKSVGLPGVKSKFALQVSHTGSPTGVVVDFDISLDGQNWKNIASLQWDEATLNSGDLIQEVTENLACFVRLTLTTLSGGTSPTVTAWITGK